MSSHDEPAPKSPVPNANPSHAPSRGVGACDHSQNSSASVASAPPPPANGGNAKTVPAPAPAATSNGSQRANVIAGAALWRAFLGAGRPAQPLDLQRVQPPAVRAQHAEAEAAERRRLAALRQATERLQQQAGQRDAVPGLRTGARLA